MDFLSRWQGEHMVVLAQQPISVHPLQSPAPSGPHGLDPPSWFETEAVLPLHPLGNALLPRRRVRKKEKRPVGERLWRPITGGRRLSKKKGLDRDEGGGGSK